MRSACARRQTFSFVVVVFGLAVDISTSQPSTDLVAGEDIARAHVVIFDIAYIVREKEIFIGRQELEVSKVFGYVYIYVRVCVSVCMRMRKRARICVKFLI